LIAQYNKASDINLGNGMVTVALASLVIGESLFGKRKLLLRIFGVILGAILYRIVIALALRLRIPTEAFKLVSALIVAIAISSTRIQELLHYTKLRRNAIRERGKDA
jgi:ABC superfamily ATP binding cassette transporter, membrane protein